MSGIHALLMGNGSPAVLGFVPMPSPRALLSVVRSSSPGPVSARITFERGGGVFTTGTPNAGTSAQIPFRYISPFGSNTDNLEISINVASLTATASGVASLGGVTLTLGQSPWYRLDTNVVYEASNGSGGSITVTGTVTIRDRTTTSIATSAVFELDTEDGS